MALHLFKQMENDAVKPDGVTYLSVLLACCHSGSLQDGQVHFDSMVKDHAIEPNPRHYACMIDLYGRAGLIDEAENFMKKMPFEPDAVVLTAFSGACRLRGEIARGKWAAQRLIELDPHADYPYIMLSHFYAAEGRWGAVAEVRQKMEQNVKNKVGRSWIEVENKFHEFVSGDGSHPCAREIYTLLSKLHKEMKQLMDFPHYAKDEQSETHILYYDSEMLAIAFGLLTVPAGKQIRVFKNLQVSPDCHAAAKAISKISGREIIVRDSNLFHHFANGICSCDGYS
jgi:pentatricopeptide repeat protein